MYTKISDDYHQYLDNVLPILDEFIKTYQGHVNSGFWDRVMNLKDDQLGSGSTKYISGWIFKIILCIDLNSNQIKLGDINLNNKKVSVEVENHCIRQKKTCYIVSGFHGVHSENHKHKPVMNLTVIEDLSTVMSLGGA
ncbi:unnamed protein product [Didymodactylos carnosus]|uniref:Uncharacterized protein n=2 Tax=Didymodactylos carnosus TaxID=1234261 RepID=A0A8S2HM87_9BILA|nr:unnamed protein product [Didymodactylos carnosus]CAF3665080.1 unnamed protein product [Didymodactylos carnosus]